MILITEQYIDKCKYMILIAELYINGVVGGVTSKVGNKNVPLPLAKSCIRACRKISFSHF